MESIKKSKFNDTVMQSVFFMSAFVSVLAVIAISLFLFLRGIPAIAEIGFMDFVFSEKWGTCEYACILRNFIYDSGKYLCNSRCNCNRCSCRSHVCCVSGRVFVRRGIYKIVKPAVNLLAGIPSIIYGFFGMQIVVPFVRDNVGGNGYSILSASIILGIMILPTIISISESSIRAVPESYKEGSFGLGATKEETIFKVVVPAAKSGVLTAIILGIGRAVGETMAVVMVAGNAVMPLDKIALLKPIRTLTTNIVTEMSYASGLHESSLIATGVVLFVFIVILNASLSLIKFRSSRN